MAKTKSTKASLIKSEKERQPSRPKNALDHGMYAEDVVLPWESREEFETLLAELHEEFQPHGRMEREVVLDLAHLRWQKQRLRKLWHAAANRDPFVSELVDFGKQSYAEIRALLRSQGTVIRSCIEATRSSFLQFSAHLNKLCGDLLKDLHGEPEFKANQKDKVIFRGTTAELGTLLQTQQKLGAEEKEKRTEAIEVFPNGQPNEFETKQQTETQLEAQELRWNDQQDELEMIRRQIKLRIDGLEHLMTEGLMCLMRTLQSLPGAEMTLDRAYSPESLEPVIRIEALIDARIDKLLGRLVSLKDYKELQANRKLARIPPAQ